MAPDPGSAAAISQAEVADVVAAVLNVAAAELRNDVPLARYGLDSLATVEVAAALEKRFGRAMAVEELPETPSLRDLAAALAGSPGAAAGRPDDPFAAMLADAALADGLAVSAAVAESAPRRILLTGATGFLGAFLVERLLREPGVSLICLVRCADPGSGLARLAAGLARYGLGGVDEARLAVLPANLALPGLGLSPADRARALEADAVCHLAAAVNWVAPYSALRALNVRATLELLALAGEGRARPFHFLSSLAVVYATRGPREVDEDGDPLAGLRGLHFGYAQSKAVAEALVRAAGRGGLPAFVYRAGLIAGSSVTGASNPEDFFSLFWRGCVRLGAAPDLDWALDACPVDHVVEVLARRLRGAAGPGALHLLNPRSRAWREAVLWMNLYGHRLALLPYGEWLARLRASLEGDDEQPLHALRGFFQARAEGGHLPEILQEGRRAAALAERSRGWLADAGIECPPLDSELMERYGDALVASGHLPPPAVRASAPGETLSFDRDFFALFFSDCEDVEAVAGGSRHSILTELTSWAYRRSYGLHRYRLRGRGGRRDLLVKVKPRDVETMAVACRVVSLADAALGAVYQPWAASLGFAEGHRRELALLGWDDARWRRHLPRVDGLVEDEEAGQFLAVLEWLEGVELLDSADDPRDWRREHLEAAVGGLATLHAVFWRREPELRARRWLGQAPAAGELVAKKDLWRELERFTRAPFEAWAGDGFTRRRQELIETLEVWWPELEKQPRTLIHHDFNPRNLCFRRTAHGPHLIAYDWELATLHAPQRDLAELLCFVLTRESSAEELRHWVERHRATLESEVGEALDPVAWRRGFGLALADFLIQRLPLYAVVDRFRRQAFLPRVVATWQHLDRLSAPFGMV